MATMATTHSLSVLTNSSVKPPRNPRTGLSQSLHEQPRQTLGRYSGIFYDDYDNHFGNEKEVYDPKSTSRIPKTADPATLIQLSNLSDDEFYQKLLELKGEQRKVLQKCEKIYIEKHKGEIVPTFCDQDSGEEKETSVEKPFSRTRDRPLNTDTFVDEDGVLVSTKRAKSPEIERYSPEPQSETSKPPTGRPPLAFTAKSFTSPARPMSAPIPRDIARSLDDLRNSVNGLRKSFEASDDEYIPDDTVSEPYRERDRSFSRIDEMWQNFSIEEYAPRRTLSKERPSSASMTRKEKTKKEETWRHRLTVPKPFTMTLREESKEKKKSRNMVEFEEKQSEQQIQEEEELKKKFKARPVPAHVYLPLFDEIQDKGEERRRQIRQSSADLLKSQEKPFSFMKREEDRKQHERFDRDCNQKVEKQIKTESAPVFKAKPVPKFVFDSSVDDKLMEEEEYRKIRIKMRAEELLHTASLPPNMSARERMKVQKEREQKLKSKKKSGKSAARPRINHEVPNYDALYRHFQKELQRRKSMKEGTVTQPFRLETEATSKSARDKMKEQLEREEQLRREDRWPYGTQKKIKLGHISTSLDSLPSKSTRSADVRNSKTRTKLQRLSDREMAEIEEDRRRRVREMRLRREIQEKTKYDTPRQKPEDKKRENREAERARMEQYEQELQEMKSRISRRPLLFEQTTQVNAKKKAEKKFNATLRSVGLDEDFVQSRGSCSASVQDYTDEYDDDFEDTAVKHREDTYTKRRDSEGSLSPEEAE
ncbi:F161A-like protein [Mya arenaria]|uniref:F161A-like protein n=1 Tax=Mya arenaria TaxID=6604 RepID=A0ABY7FF65_MYAAR|nr:protein FAM161A-like [Mya arenaria]WAR19576.1 F161A-like protein [Mya arenaria]